MNIADSFSVAQFPKARSYLSQGFSLSLGQPSAQRLTRPRPPRRLMYMLPSLPLLLIEWC